MQAAAEPGSVVSTDHWSGYKGLVAAGFRRWPGSVSASGEAAHVAMSHVHRVDRLIAGRS